MNKSKFAADLLTSLRLFFGLGLIWLGVNRGADGIGLAVLLMLGSWISDYFDGYLARRSKSTKVTWIGAHDLQIDMFVSLCLLFYLSTSDFLPTSFVLYYAFFWGLFFLWKGISKSYGAIFQAPTYGFFLWTAWLVLPGSLVPVFAWLTGNIVFNWRRLTSILIPEFFVGLRAIGKQKSSKIK